MNPKQWLTTFRSVSRSGDVKLSFPLGFKLETCIDGTPVIELHATDKVYRGGFSVVWVLVGGCITAEKPLDVSVMLQGP